MSVRSLMPSTMTLIRPTTVNVTLTSSTGNVRSTASMTPDYATYSNLVFANPGRVVIEYNSNLYFGGTDNVGSITYMNYAYQPLQPGTNMPGLPGDVNMNVMILNYRTLNNFVGNAKIAASDWEMVNPMGHTGSTAFRLRNWDSRNIYNTASNALLSYMEVKLDNVANLAKINADRDIALTFNETSLLIASGSTQTVTIPSNNRFRVNQLSGSGTRPVYSDVNGNLTNSVSDARLKEDISTLPYGLNTVMQLNPISFYWKTQFADPNTGNTINLREMRGADLELGFLAQEAKQVIPEAVGENEDGTLYVDYVKMIPVLVKAIQELRRDNEELRSLLIRS